MTDHRVHWSTLKALAESPLAYRWLTEHPREDTPSLLLGRAVHCAILEPDRYPAAYVVAERADGTPIRRDARTAEYRDFLAAHPGAEILTRADYDQARVMSDAVWADRAASRVLGGSGALIEHRLSWTDAGTGIECAGRIDWYRAGVLLDLKTTRCDLSMHAVGSEVARYSYHAQLAWYADALRAGGVPVETVYVLAVQSVAPHDVGVFVLEAEALEAGRQHYRSLLARLVECRERDAWPGRYDGQIQSLIVPDWAEGMPDDSEINLGD